MSFCPDSGPSRSAHTVVTPGNIFIIKRSPLTLEKNREDKNLRLMKTKTNASASIILVNEVLVTWIT